jgi:ribosome-binding factor A
MSRRTERIASTLLEELARLLREDVTDPRIGLVTLTRVDVAPDLSNAIVHYSTLEAGGGDEQRRIDEGLASAAGFLRRRAARALPLKRMPELRFRYDPSLSLGSQTLGLLREIADEAPTSPEAPNDGDGGSDGEAQ